MNEYFSGEVTGLDISSLPEWLQEVLQPLIEKGGEIAPQVFWSALNYVWEREVEYVPAPIIAEMEGIGAGVCASDSAPADCDADEWATKIKNINVSKQRWFVRSRGEAAKWRRAAKQRSSEAAKRRKAAKQRSKAAK
jgi:hypothetical protein